MGPVFRGEDGETREPVVIKVVRVGLTPERAAVVGTALASLHERIPAHPALAACLGAGVVDVEPFVVSAYVEGDSLDVALREYGPALLVDALPRLRVLADGLDAAAAAGVSHGSLHPRDILVAVEHTVLQGLGVAGVLERVGVRPPVRRPYCAPEVALGLGISPAGDQYSLAAVAHEWLTGRRLAAGQEHAVRVPGLTGDAADRMRDVFARALAEAPAERFPTATAFVEAMAELAPHAAGRSKSSRRAPAAAAPRLSFDEPEEPAAALPPAIVAGVSAAGGSVPTDEQTADLDEVDEFLGVPPAAPGALLDLPVVRDTRDDGGWDDNPLREFSAETDVAVPTAEVPRLTAGIPDDASPAGRASEDAVDDDEVAPDDGEDVGDAPRIVTPAVPEPDFVEVSLPIHAAGPTSWDSDDAAPMDEPSASDASDLATEESDRGWTRWVVGIAAFSLLAVAGGWALVQWGTPAAPREGTTATATTPAPSAAPSPQPEPPAATTPEPARERPAAPAATPAPASEAPAAAPGRPAPAPTAPRATPTPPGEARSTPAAPTSQAPPAPRPARQTPAPRPAPRQAPPRPAPSAAAPAAPAANAARLLVRSTPGGAEVFVNGERRGVTPLALRDLPLGSYAVRVTRPGYAAVDERVVLDRGRPSRSLELTLVRAGGAAGASPPAARSATASATTGTLVVETRPPGARVIVDGNDIGVTPVTLPSIAVGAHRLRIERPGYTSITTTTTIEAGARARVAVTLTPERP